MADSNKLMTMNTGDLWTAYAYDENGNNTSRESYTLTTENGTTSQTSVEYLTMTYDSLNRMTKAQKDGMTAEYTYGIDNMRRSKTVNGATTNYIWDGGNIVAEADCENAITNRYFRGVGFIASKTGDTISYYQTDSHGDVSKWGTVDYSYDAFGNETTASNGTNPFRYNGECQDEETGFIYLRNRYYDPASGRFITEDPICDGLNWYAYCENNPVMFVDPWGLEGIVVSGGMYSKNDSWPYEFVEPALNKIWEWKDANPNETITWLVAMAGWTDDDIADFQSAIHSIEGINVIGFTNSKQLINYINSKDLENSNLSYARTSDQITKFAVFSHGLVDNDGTIALGFYFNNSSDLQIVKSDIENINSAAFASANRSAFYSCNTGTMGENSFAQKWANKTGGETWAFVGKSDYTHILDGQTLEIRIARFFGGFYWGGSWNLPVAGTSKIPAGPWKGEIPFMKMFSPY